MKSRIVIEYDEELSKSKSESAAVEIKKLLDGHFHFPKITVTHEPDRKLYIEDFSLKSLIAIELLFSQQFDYDNFVPKANTAYYMFNGRDSFYDTDSLKDDIRKIIDDCLSNNLCPAGLKRGKINVKFGQTYQAKDHSSVVNNYRFATETEFREYLFKMGINPILFKNGEFFIYGMQFFDAECESTVMIERFQDSPLIKVPCARV